MVKLKSFQHIQLNLAIGCFNQRGLSTTLDQVPAAGFEHSNFHLVAYVLIVKHHDGVGSSHSPLRHLQRVLCHVFLRGLKAQKI